MTIDFNKTETLFVSALFQGKTDDNKPLSLIATWDTKSWNIDEIVFEDPNNNNDTNRQQVIDFFNSQMKQ